MRPSEIILLAFDLILLLLIFRRSVLSRSGSTIVVGAAALILLFHFVVDGYRWQMVLAYCLMFVLVLLSLPNFAYKISGQWKGWLGASIGFVLVISLLLAVLVPALLPVPSLKKPSGRFPVGTTTLHFVDPNRLDPYSLSPDAPREIMIQLWYPAEVESEQDPGAYIEQLELAAPIISQRLGLPSFLLQHLELVHTNSFRNPPPAASDVPFPLILFSHGLGGLRMQNTALFEHLASHGYIVASADHTFDSIFSVFPDGTVTLHKRETIFPKGVPMLEAGNQLVNVRTKDLELIVNRLKTLALSNENQVALAIDFDKIGVAGHSTGGGTALSYCFLSPDCRAILALDGWLEPVDDETLRQNLGKPAMFINTPEWLNQNNQQLGKEYFDIQQESTFELSVAGMNHNNFTDIPLLSPLTPTLGLAGSIDRHAGLKIVNDYTLAFFNQFLLNDQQLILQGPNEELPELTFKFNEN